MRKWMRRAALAQVVAWISFALCIALVGLPLWLPTPLTLSVMTVIGR